MRNDHERRGRTDPPAAAGARAGFYWATWRVTVLATERVRPARVRRATAGAGTALVALAISACTTVPITGRQSFNVFSLEDDRVLGAEAYQEVLTTSPIVSSGADKLLVERAMQRLTAVADDPGFEWEVVLIDEPGTVNAFCLPGGKMAVYTGILPVTQNEAGLATVMGHEIAHAIARHGTERVTQQALSEGLLSQINPDYQVLGGLALDLAVALPYSRSHESEADHIGLIYMARAGYDPREAVSFWQRMAQVGGSSWEVLSTHPSDQTRVADLERLLPEALAIYQAGGGR